jgi:AcrR family transcriptional regulator
MGEPATSTDGRRARRERGRLAVIDAMFELVQEGKVPPPAEAIAQRSGVSVASVFRYFDGIADLQFQTFERFRQRFEPLVHQVIDGSLDERIAALVDARLELYERAGMLMMMGRLRALEHAPMVEASARWRATLADQVRRAFAPESAVLDPAAANDLLAVIDALTALESWDVMRRTHSRSRAQIARTWCDGIAALVVVAADRHGREGAVS